MSSQSYINEVLEHIKRVSPRQPIFFQAAREVLTNLTPLLDKEPKYQKHSVLERIVMPEKTTIFRTVYIDDNSKAQVHFGYRVQFNSSLGPYKGGLRFHPTVNLDVLKFLGFEQIFKNSLTGLNLGGGKGGANFDPKGKSDGEIMRFCQAFMNDLYKLIEDVKDVPAGDIGVGAREIGYMYGQYKKLTGRFDGAMTGKGLSWGGSLARTEATGYGSVYFATEALKKKGKSLDGKRCVISGAGNVAIYTAQKLYEFGATPVTVSDSRGYVYDEEGVDIALLKEIKEVRRASLSEYAKEKKSAKFVSVNDYKSGRNEVYDVPCQAAFPSATQNELNLDDVKTLYANGCRLVCEGANMPSTHEAMEFMLSHDDFIYCPGKAANAGGVATSGLEMEQNASMTSWSFDRVDGELKNIMKNIFDIAYQTSVEYGKPGNLVLGANIAGFKKVADAMIDQGYI
ncbi:NADP-specific glutamate dehydrogenase [Campylobacter corcagiensis]|uniref:Glutamate dehydrogenase n=1 Tax=Campylobacter corcagiensis TaxID=1448857 RepID=A0A7M1LJQ9_9BACT|nr:NADP-specific glutamate dehydrogenase [Campylobacter corcagiensis]QKF65378.1 glutamate dehydrogenase [Campylobacter corcagiensis]QOQ88046.1 NADP-specific glutamate dehydrogenase [Campylobacter corcagiensis]